MKYETLMLMFLPIVAVFLVSCQGGTTGPAQEEDVSLSENQSSNSEYKKIQVGVGEIFELHPPDGIKRNFRFRLVDEEENYVQLERNEDMVNRFDFDESGTGSIDLPNGMLGLRKLRKNDIPFRYDESTNKITVKFSKKEDDFQEEYYVEGKQFLDGSESLIIYPSDYSPTEVSDAGQDTFSLRLEVENKGEASIGPRTSNPFVEFSLENINPAEWGASSAKTSQELKEYLRGSYILGSKSNEGDQTRIAFRGLSYKPDLDNDKEINMKASACYDYSTQAVAEICIDEDNLKAPGCSGTKLLTNSRGPIQITNMKRETADSETIRVTFTVENKGEEDVYARSEGCSLANKDKVNIDFNNMSTSGWDISCPGLDEDTRGTLDLSRGDQTISCILQKTSSGGSRHFSELLDVDLRYRYYKSTDIPITVRDTVGKTASEIMMKAILPNRSVETGETFPVHIRLENGKKIAGFQFTLTYDPSILKLQGSEEGNLLKKDGSSTFFRTHNTSSKTFQVISVRTSGDGISGSGKLATLNFEALKRGTSSLKFNNSLLSTPDAREVPIEVEDASITIE